MERKDGAKDKTGRRRKGDGGEKGERKELSEGKAAVKG